MEVTFLVYDPLDTKEISNGHVTLDRECESEKLLATPSYISFFFSGKICLTEKASGTGRGDVEDSDGHPNSTTRGTLQSSGVIPVPPWLK